MVQSYVYARENRWKGLKPCKWQRRKQPQPGFAEALLALVKLGASPTIDHVLTFSTLAREHIFVGSLTLDAVIVTP